MKKYQTSLEGLRRIVEIIKRGNPPDGMTREEWYAEIATAMKEANGTKD